MKLDLTVLISLGAIGIMCYGLWLVYRLKPSIPGGIVGATWNTLTLLVTFFTVGFLATPFFPLIPPEIVYLIASLIFFFGAIYVVVTIRMIYRVIKELTGD